MIITIDLNEELDGLRRTLHFPTYDELLFQYREVFPLPHVLNAMAMIPVGQMKQPFIDPYMERMRDWCLENCEGAYSIFPLYRWGLPEGRIRAEHRLYEANEAWFELERDAALFKLRWYGVQDG